MNKLSFNLLNKKTDKLEKFSKNKKQKKVIIGSIIGLILLIGGITLYRTFALYEEKREFDVLKGRISEFGTKYTESTLNGADPVLKGNLIPVEIGNDGTVTKANVYDKWYNYEEKKWANAVILNDKTKIYENGETIPESNIESYFVWIPKYSYQLWDLGTYNSLTGVNTSKVHVIPIKFGLENTNDSKNGECTTPMTSGSSGKCKIGDYMTPPAFISMGTNGLWVGKFETGYKGATTTAAAQTNTNIEAPEKVQIKPNVYSWRNIQPANAHLTSYNYQRELDSHMMKNTEWGAVAYLQHSAYGSATSVRSNNNSAYITGYAAVSASSSTQTTDLGKDGTYTINYKNTASQVASTTGNYSGIYDMSGGATESTMGVMLDYWGNSTPLCGQTSTSNAGFNGKCGVDGTLTTGIDFPASKYYDKYFSNQDCGDEKYKRRILGDGTAEFGPFSSSYAGSWYGSVSRATGIWGPWTIRNSVHGFDRESGAASGAYGFRIVLAI